MSITIASDIEALDIGPGPPISALLREADLSEPAAAVVAGCVVAFAPGVSEQHREDVSQSLLLAQLAANAKAERHKDPVGWFAAYRAVLEQIAWVVGASSSAARYMPPFATFNVGTVAGDTFRSKLSAEDLDVVSSAVAALRSGQNSGALLAFECPSHSGGIGNFQVVLATEDDGAVTLRIAQISFNAPQHVVRLVFEDFGKTAQFRAAFLAATMNEPVYARFRPTIASKLEGRYPAAVAMLQL